MLADGGSWTPDGTVYSKSARYSLSYYKVSNKFVKKKKPRTANYLNIYILVMFISYLDIR